MDLARRSRMDVPGILWGGFPAVRNNVDTTRAQLDTCACALRSRDRYYLECSFTVHANGWISRGLAPFRSLVPTVVGNVLHACGRDNPRIFHKDLHLAPGIDLFHAPAVCGICGFALRCSPTLAFVARRRPGMASARGGRRTCRAGGRSED